MLWIIGDIHGMFDPCKRLINQIRKHCYYHGKKKESTKLIFLGDYIDHGPSSKEVIDFPGEIEFETVLLAGNHEDLLLQYYNQSYLFKKYGNVCFRGNGGQNTVFSFLPGEKHHNKIFNNERVEPEEIMLSDKYLDFFKRLKYIHTESIELTDDEKIRFIFVHGALNPEYDIREQLNIKKYHQFQKYLEEKKIWIEDTFIWNRNEIENRINNSIMFCGHTPTEQLPAYYQETGSYKADSHLPFCKFNDMDYIVRRSYNKYSFNKNTPLYKF